MDQLTDIFADDAFSLISLTASINDVDHVPGRAGELCFAGVGEGVATETVMIERSGSALTLIQTSKRGAPSPQGDIDKATVRSVGIPQIKLEDTVGAHQIQGVRAFGSSNGLVGAQTVVNQRLAKLGLRHDMTLEHHRLTALQGKILDADGSALTDLFELFGVTNDNSGVGGSGTDKARKIFAYDLDETASDPVDIRVQNQEITRFVKRVAKTIIPGTAEWHVFCGDEFFDALISREDVKAVYQRTAEQQIRLGNNYAFGSFEFGGFIYENYQGTDDNSSVSIATDEASLFLTGVPGLYAEYFAPADFMETVNTVGLPRYARTAVDPELGRWVKLHTQQNPLPLCLRPQTLVRLKLGTS